MKRKHLDALVLAKEASERAHLKSLQAIGATELTAGNLSQLAEAHKRRIESLERQVATLSDLVDALIERNRPKPEECEHRWYFISAHGQGNVFQYQCYQCNTQKEVMAHDLEKDSQ